MNPKELVEIPMDNIVEIQFTITAEGKKYGNRFYIRQNDQDKCEDEHERLTNLLYEWITQPLRAKILVNWYGKVIEEDNDER